jgi:hypothetical protein
MQRGFVCTLFVSALFGSCGRSAVDRLMAEWRSSRNCAEKSRVFKIPGPYVFPESRSRRSETRSFSPDVFSMSGAILRRENRLALTDERILVPCVSGHRQARPNRSRIPAYVDRPRASSCRTLWADSALPV